MKKNCAPPQERPAYMPGRRGVVVDVDPEMHAETPWKVQVRRGVREGSSFTAALLA
jgi:heat shock protein HspQ